MPFFFLLSPITHNAPQSKHTEILFMPLNLYKRERQRGKGQTERGEAEETREEEQAGNKIQE